LNMRAFPRLAQVCSERGLDFCGVDLRWGITAEQSGRGKVIEMCTNEINNCCYFVCMLGERYGWAQASQPPYDELFDKTLQSAIDNGFPWMSMYADRSVTEIEILHAALRHPTLQPSRKFFYTRDSKYEIPGHPELSQSENEESAEKLRRLKSQLRRWGYVNRPSYATPEQFADWVVADVSAAINRDFPRENKMSVPEIQAHLRELFLEGCRRNHLPRQSLLNEMDRHLLSTSSSHQSTRILVISGDIGIGKTCLVANWTKSLMQKWPKWNMERPPFVFEEYITNNGFDINHIAMKRRLLAALIERTGSSETVPPSESLFLLKYQKIFLRLVEADLDDQGIQPAPIVLVFDGFDQIPAQDAIQFIEWLRPPLPRNVFVVLSATEAPGLTWLASGQPYVAHLKVEGIWERTEKEAFAETYLQKFSKTMDEGQMGAVVASKRTDNCLFMRTVVEQLRMLATFETLSGLTEELLAAPTVEHLYERVFQKWEIIYGPVLMKIFGILRVAKHGLSESEILDILKLPAAEWVEVSTALQYLLNTESGVVRFSHASISRIVEDKFLNPNTGEGQALTESLMENVKGFFQEQQAKNRWPGGIPDHLRKNAKELGIALDGDGDEEDPYAALMRMLKEEMAKQAVLKDINRELQVDCIKALKTVKGVSVPEVTDEKGNSSTQTKQQQATKTFLREGTSSLEQQYIQMLMGYRAKKEEVAIAEDMDSYPKLLKQKQRLVRREAVATESREVLMRQRRTFVKDMMKRVFGPSLDMKTLEIVEGELIDKVKRLRKVRLKSIRLRLHKEGVERALKAKDFLADGLTLIDFEQLKIENQALNEKIDERGEDIGKLKREIATCACILAHCKEKHEFVQKENVILRTTLDGAEKDLHEERTRLAHLKMQRDHVRVSNNDMARTRGLRGNAHLLQSFDQDKLDLLHKTANLETLRGQYVSIQAETDVLRTTISLNNNGDTSPSKSIVFIPGPWRRRGRSRFQGNSLRSSTM